MSLTSPGSGERLGPAQLDALIDGFCETLERAEVPMTKSQLAATTRHQDVSVNVALDRALTNERLVRRVIGGRIVYHLPDWTPGAHKHPAQVEAAPRQPAMKSSGVSYGPALTKAIDLVLKHVTALSKPARGPEIFEALQITQNLFSQAIRVLERDGLIVRAGAGNKTFYSLSSQPALSKPDAQPIDASPSTAAPAAPVAPSGAVREPAGPRDGLSLTPLETHVIERSQQFHERAAAAEAERRIRAMRLVAGEAAERPSTLGEMSEAMRNTGALDDDDVATAVHVEDARFALWNDGRLEIDAGDQHITLSKAVTRNLFDYLDLVCAIDHH